MDERGIEDAGNDLFSFACKDACMVCRLLACGDDYVMAVINQLPDYTVRTVRNQHMKSSAHKIANSDFPARRHVRSS